MFRQRREQRRRQRGGAGFECFDHALRIRAHNLAKRGGERTGNCGLAGELRHDGHGVGRRSECTRIAAGSRGSLRGCARARMVRRETGSILRQALRLRVRLATHRRFGQRQAGRQERSVVCGGSPPGLARVVGQSQLPEHFAKVKQRHRRIRVFARRAAKARDGVRGTLFELVLAAAREPVGERGCRHLRCARSAARTGPGVRRARTRPASVWRRSAAARATRPSHPRAPPGAGARGSNGGCQGR